MYVVAYINFFDNELKIKIAEAEDWKEALVKTFDQVFEGDDLETAKENAFNQDVLFDVIEVEGKRLC